MRLIMRLVWDKLHDRTTYGVALIVGTLINAYGQLLVPWFRGSVDPILTFVIEFELRPELTILSVFLAYAFPFCVGIYSTVATRYKNRRIESIADFPERKPDPVFRVNRNGRLVEVGANTKALFDKYKIDCAQKILGEELWFKIISGANTEERPRVYFEAEGVEYMVAHARTGDDQINIYMTRLPG